MNTFLLCAGILFASGLLRFALIVRFSKMSRADFFDSNDFSVTAKINTAISIASFLGVIYIWVIFYRDIVAAGLPVAG